MSIDSKLALVIDNLGIGDQICLIPSLKKLKERFGQFDILSSDPSYNDPKLRFFSESEYVRKYKHIKDNELLQIKRNDIILYDEIRHLSHPGIWEMLNKSEHLSIRYLKQLNLEYNDDTPEKEIEINLPKDRVDEYAYFNDYYLIAPCHIKPNWGKWFDLSIYSELVKRFSKNIKFITLYNLPLPYETETFWTDNLDQLQFFLKSVKGVVTIDSCIQHYCNALRKKALVLWGYGESRVKKFGYKSHINIFNKESDLYDDLPNDTHQLPQWVDHYIRKDIDYEIFFESFEELIEETKCKETK